MRIIDANTGHEPSIGETYRNVHGDITLLSVVDESLFGARAVLKVNGKRVEVPLQVRYTHPAFFLQKIAFIPS